MLRKAHMGQADIATFSGALQLCLGTSVFNIALTIRIGFRGTLYYNYNKEPPKIV